MAEQAQPFPDLTPTAHFCGLKVGDQIEVLWTEDARPVPAEVKQTVAFGALVAVDPTTDPAWSCGPFDMYVTQQCPDGSWAR
jgi:hypothetical protein